MLKSTENVWLGLDFCLCMGCLALLLPQILFAKGEILRFSYLLHWLLWKRIWREKDLGSSVACMGQRRYFLQIQESSLGQPPGRDVSGETTASAPIFCKHQSDSFWWIWPIFGCHNPNKVWWAAALVRFSAPTHSTVAELCF